MILLILSLLFQTQQVSVSAVEQEKIYARIMFEQVYLYKTPTNNNTSENVYFELPRTYFVELLKLEGEFYQAKYMSLIGYVKKDSVQAVLGTPINPFLNNITFRVYADLSETIWSTPSINSNKITTIPHLTKNIYYYGKIQGERLIEGRTNIWFFCKYSTPESEYYGYVYSDFCDDIPTFTNNTETLNYINNPTFNVNTEQEINTIPKQSNLVGVIVGILSIPAIIFVLLIMNSTRIFNKEKTKSQEIMEYNS